MFEFDPAKSAANLAKHGIDFEQAQMVWGDGDGIEGEAQFIGEPRREFHPQKVRGIY